MADSGDAAPMLATLEAAGAAWSAEADAAWRRQAEAMKAMIAVASG